MIGLLALDGILVGAFSLVTTPLHVQGVPVPIGALLSAVLVPWLVRLAGEEDPRPAVAGVPLWAWLGTIALLGPAGPGGDVLLPATWQSLLLVLAGVAAGLWMLRAVADRTGAGRYSRRDQ